MKVIAATASAILILALVLWRPWEDKAGTPDLTEVKVHSAPSAPASTREADPLPSNTGPREATTPPAEAEPEISPTDRQRAMTAIENLGFTLRDYSTAMKGNPVGTNAEITAALLGDNPKQVKLEVPEGSTLNTANELCDPWGTPWFFHQLSASKTEIRTAGPDKKMYTADDVVR